MIQCLRNYMHKQIQIQQCQYQIQKVIGSRVCRFNKLMESMEPRKSRRCPEGQLGTKTKPREIYKKKVFEGLKELLTIKSSKGVGLLLNLKEIVDRFSVYVEAENIEIYNEFSLQHELGIFLRGELGGYFVQFERNVSYFPINSKTIKKEIDISIFSEDKSERYAIELKHP